MSKRIMRLLNEGGDCARFVGGCVRDSLINLKTNDIVNVELDIFSKYIYKYSN